MQRLKVSVILADKNSRKLMFSGRPKEKEEVVEKKRSLMVCSNVINQLLLICSFSLVKKHGANLVVGEPGSKLSRFQLTN